jgi:hypothetical protein
MKIVIAVCKKDLQLAEAQATLIKKLGGLQAHSCLLVVAPEANRLEGKLADILSQAFPRFERHVLKGAIQEPGPAEERLAQPHVLSANQMFQATWRHLISSGNTEEVYWLEPDCVPLNDRWADELARDYLTARAYKKVFMGAFVPKTNITKKDGAWVAEIIEGQQYMMGSGVYPADISQYSGLWSQAKTSPWDALMQWETTRLGYPTTKIVHNHGTKNYKVVEPMTKDGAVLSCDLVNEWGISTTELHIPSDALVIHGCKDTSLIDLVMSKALFKAPKASPNPNKTESNTPDPTKPNETQNKPGFILED